MLNALRLNSANYLTGKAPVKFAALYILDIFNRAGIAENDLLLIGWRFYTPGINW